MDQNLQVQNFFPHCTNCPKKGILSEYPF